MVSLTSTLGGSSVDKTINSPRLNASASRAEITVISNDAPIRLSQVTTTTTTTTATTTITTATYGEVVGSTLGRIAVIQIVTVVGVIIEIFSCALHNNNYVARGRRSRATCYELREKFSIMTSTRQSL